ncbi:hypothetical protein EJ08DRAFT_433451 [Tothia fuscella]|uniref:Uncharacterized protein n=1 Tax=Tothia fuscella TaxID=1048955 RepID=A0A9P4U2T1_9PEZI|nr:hypothetical protein EJ08DRAFT_433451 [Tothia fuscella]
MYLYTTPPETRHDPGSLNYTPQYLPFPSQLAHALNTPMSECGCFASALQISDQLHRTETALTSTSFDQVLTVARHAQVVCRQYANCSRCSDPSYFTIYIIILRKATACYRYLVRSSSSTNSSPATGSTSSSSNGVYNGTSRLRIGNFEVDAPLDDHTRTVILRTEVRRAIEAAAHLDAVLSPHSVKTSRDEATLSYLRGLVDALKEEISSVERSLY